MISVIFCTKEHTGKHIDHIKKMFGHPSIEVIEYINKGEGLTKFYKMGLEEAKYDIVVFLHDDIIIETKQVARKLKKLYDSNPEYGILGVAGSKYMPESGMWWEKTNEMYGRVSHTHEGKTWLSVYSDDIKNDVTETVIVDGVFFSVHKKRIKEDFNLDVTGFHFYDVDFCFRNHLAGVKIGVHTNIRINHLSIGQTNEEWEENKKTFAETYKDNLPVKIDRVFNGKERFKIMVVGNTITDSIELSSKLKDSRHQVTICAPLRTEDRGNIQTLKKKNIQFVPINEPPSYKVGDGKWSMNTAKGAITSEPNKLYRVGSTNFDIMHISNPNIGGQFKSLYPEIPMSELPDTTNIEGIIEDYQEKLK